MKSSKTNPRLGKCYQLAYNYVIEHPQFKLVHGYITNRFTGNQTIDHAWVENDIEVFDPVLDKNFPKDVYYALLDADPAHSYTAKEANEFALKTGVFGPWRPLKSLDLSMYDKNGRLKKRPLKDYQSDKSFNWERFLEYYLEVLDKNILLIDNYINILNSNLIDLDRTIMADLSPFNNNVKKLNHSRYSQSQLRVDFVIEYYVDQEFYSYSISGIFFAGMNRTSLSLYGSRSVILDAEWQGSYRVYTSKFKIDFK